MASAQLFDIKSSERHRTPHVILEILGSLPEQVNHRGADGIPKSDDKMTMQTIQGRIYIKQAAYNDRLKHIKFDKKLTNPFYSNTIDIEFFS